MKTVLVPFAAAWIGLAVPTAPAVAQDKKEEKSNLPGKATWDLKAFNTVFRVVKTDYDAKKNQVRWVLETKEGLRTFDFVRSLDRDQPFVFTFLDGDANELQKVQLKSTDFQGIPKEKVMKEGTRLEVTLDVPEVIGKTAKVVLKRMKGE